jgi:glycine oxidase
MGKQDQPGTSETADAVVIGGGVIGLAIARDLARRGVGRIALIERGRLGGEASFAAGGMLAPQAEADSAGEFFQLACRSRDLYPAFAEGLREESGTDIELDTTGTLYLGLTEEDEEELEHRYIWQSRAGLQVERLSPDEARYFEPGLSPSVRLALRFPLDGQVENRRLVTALATSAERLGVRLMTGANVESLKTSHGRIEGVVTSLGAVHTAVAIVAGGAWSSLVNSTDSPLPVVRIEPVRGQMLCFEAYPRPFRHVIYSPRGYLVPRLDGRLLAGSTTEHAGFDKSVTGSGIYSMTKHALEMAPLVGELPLADAWAGLRPRAEDDLPVIGPCGEVEGLYYATGHYRNGILLAPITGELIGRSITEGIHVDLSAFSPDRWNLVAAN